MAADPPSETTLYCSFCLRSQHEVAKLVAGPGRIFICDGCVALCNAWMADRTPDLSAFTPPAELPTERLLAQLKPIEDTLQGKGNQLQWVVDTLRAREVSWALIGSALGVSRQSAWERFSVSAALKSGGLYRDRDLSDADWAEADLADAVFETCVIEGAKLTNTVLTGARFKRCRLPACRFSHGDLREAVFEDCVFTDAQRKAPAVFAFTRLDEARLTRCDLTGAAFDGADLYGLVLQDCNLMGARFARSSFARAFGRSVVRVAASLTDCNFELADLSAMRLPGCDLSRCRLRETDLSGADLSQASLAGADLFQAIVDGANFSGADLRGAELSGFDLRRLAAYANLKVLPGQQFQLLDAMGVDVQPD